MAFSNTLKSDLSLKLQQSVAEPLTMEEPSCVNKKQMSLSLAIIIALLIEGGMFAGIAFYSRQPEVKTQEVQQITEFIPMELPSPPAPMTPPAPEPVPDLPPEPTSPPEPVKMETPKPLEQAVIKQQPVEKKLEKKIEKKPEKKVEPKKEKIIEPQKTVSPENTAPIKPEVKPEPIPPKAPPVATINANGNSNAVSLSRTKPTYPRKALSMGVEGSVKLNFTVSASGDVTNVKVLESNPPRLFDQEAIEAVKGWKFKPRLEDGKAVDSTVTQVIEFKLSDQ